MTMKTRQLKPVECSESSPKREVYSNIILPQETRKTSNRQPNFTPKQVEKGEQKTSKDGRWIEIIKIRTEINGKKRKKKQ